MELTLKMRTKVREPSSEDNTGPEYLRVTRAWQVSPQHGGGTNTGHPGKLIEGHGPNGEVCRWGSTVEASVAIGAGEGSVSRALCKAHERGETVAHCLDWSIEYITISKKGKA